MYINKIYWCRYTYLLTMHDVLFEIFILRCKRLSSAKINILITFWWDNSAKSTSLAHHCVVSTPGILFYISHVDLKRVTDSLVVNFIPPFLWYILTQVLWCWYFVSANMYIRFPLLFANNISNFLTGPE